MMTMVIKRLFWAIPTLLAISVISFVIIQLPPGDYLSSYVAALEQQGTNVSEAQIEALRNRYGLDDPIYVKYGKWMAGLSPVGWYHGQDSWTGYPYIKWPDMGMSLEWNQPVSTLIGQRLALTLLISIVTVLFTWSLAIPIGVYSAVRQYSFGDNVVTLLGFLGLATPNFLLALLVMFVSTRWFGVSAGGLYSPSMQNAPWSLAKVGDLLAHLWVPVLVIGTAGTAGLIRVMRGNLLDELSKQYVVTARAKGLRWWYLVFKYPVRVAINPLVSTVGWMLPGIVSGSIIVSVVLGLPTTGPLLLQSLKSQDMYLAGSMVMMLATLTVIGTLISDILLLMLDPRIRYEAKARA